MSTLGWVCPTPQTSCGGMKCDTNNLGNRRGTALFTYHATPEEVLNCYGRYLRTQGYERISRREYRIPGGGILVLSKKPGSPVRRGKGDFGKQRPMATPHIVMST